MPNHALQETREKARALLSASVSRRITDMKQNMRCAIIVALVLAGTFAFCGERVVVRDIEPTQAGVVKFKEYYGENDLLMMRESLMKPKGSLNAKGDSDTLIVQSRDRYFYNGNKQQVLQISEYSNGTLMFVTITEYNHAGQIIAERSFDSNGHNHFTRLSENGKTVRVIEEERDKKTANKPDSVDGK